MPDKPERKPIIDTDDLCPGFHLNPVLDKNGVPLLLVTVVHLAQGKRTVVSFTLSADDAMKLAEYFASSSLTVSTSAKSATWATPEQSRRVLN